MATLYNQYIYKNGAWMKIGTSSDSITYTLSYSALTGLLTLTGSDGSTSTVTIESGSSDVITGITVNGTTVTVTDGVAAISVPTTLSAFTNDVGYITSYTETDPVFSASAAAGITATDISNWNAKSDTDEKLKTTTALPSTTQYYPIFGNYDTTSSSKYISSEFRVRNYNGAFILQLGQAASSNPTRGVIDLISDQPDARVHINTSATADRTIVLPDASGTLALTSNIPTIPTNVSAFTNDVGYITNYTESDPLFSASVAAGITSTDITNWNAKSNTDEKLKIEQASQGTYYPVLSTDSNSASTKFFDTDLWYNFGPTLSSLSIGGTRFGRLIIKNGTTAGVRLQANGSLESIVAVNLPTTSGTLALTSDIPAQASISSTGLITYKNSGGTSLFTLQLPLYNGGVS